MPIPSARLPGVLVYRSRPSRAGVRILKDLAKPIEGREVVVVEDILDTGHTLSYVIEHLRSKQPRSVRLCTLLDKPARRIVPIQIDYRGFEIPDKFVVGYGLDYAERYRNLPFIGVSAGVYRASRHAERSRPPRYCVVHRRIEFSLCEPAARVPLAAVPAPCA